MDREHLVELVTAESAAEAEQLAQRLRRAGIGALANAEPVHPDPAHIGKTPALRYRSFVLVAEPDRERALAMIHAEQKPEGSATTAEIEAGLADHAQRERDGHGDCDRDGVPDDSDAAWQNRVWGERWHAAADRWWQWLVRAAWLAFGCVVVYLVVRFVFA